MRPENDADDSDPLPTDGMEVEEVRDADTARLFVLEWRRRVRLEMGEVPAERHRASGPTGMMTA